MTINTYSPAELLARLAQKKEIALLDPREEGLFVTSHLLLASSAPLWRLEVIIQRLVPRFDTPIVFADPDGSLSLNAAAKLLRLGYTDVGVLSGGIEAWQQAGYEVFIDKNVPSKAFGERVEIDARTPHITAAELQTRLRNGEKTVIVDGRPAGEFYNFSLPGAYNIPNGELPYRIGSLVSDLETLIVVNCAGRTRSIIGAQALINAGVKQKVVSLQGGTMSWLIEGYTLAHGQSTILPEPDPQHLVSIQQTLQTLTNKLGIRSIDTAELTTFQRDLTRTSYLFDIRNSEEYHSGHLPGWRYAAGGQLVQATDQYLATRNPRIVLADWDGVRAPLTASWLAQLGYHEVYLYQPPKDARLVTGAEAITILPDSTLPLAPWISAGQAADKLAHHQAVIYDIDNSIRYFINHIRGAKFVAPHRLIEFIAAEKAELQPILTSQDGVLAQYVARQLIAQGIHAVALLGGNQEWFNRQLPTEQGGDGILTGEQDTRYSGYEYALITTQASLAVRDEKFKAYLRWEVELLEQLKHPGGQLDFAIYHPTITE